MLSKDDKKRIMDKKFGFFKDVQTDEIFEYINLISNATPGRDIYLVIYSPYFKAISDKPELLAMELSTFCDGRFKRIETIEEFNELKKKETEKYLEKEKEK